MRSFVIGLVLLFAVFTFVGALEPSPQTDTLKASVEMAQPGK